MSYRRRKRPDHFPSKLVGWLNIWDVEKDNVQRHCTEGRQCIPLFQPYFCVIRQDLKTLQCFKSETAVDELSSLVCLPVIRLDEGKQQFDRRWGYEALESIKENALFHCDDHHRLSTERLYKNKLDTTFNESLPDLSRSYDSSLFPKRRHVFKKFFHTSYEKLVGEKDIRRGSVPAVPAAVDEDSVMMDTATSTTSSTPSRFTNFLIRKGFKSNLKRAKSATKLDRKRAAANTPDAESSTLVGTLRRTMSLGRLTRKRTRTKSTDHDNHKVHPHQHNHQSQHHHQHKSLSVISSRIKSSQSHESLLTAGSSPSPLHAVDLTAPDMEVRPLHGSILTQDHCFQVATMHGSKYISCRNAQERDKWITSLRKSANPQQENSRRSETSLKVWVQEAKTVPPKKRYFCEICLDKTLYARTSIKMKGDMLFWGEQFEFNNLPPVEFLIVNLYREADKKKKKDRNTLIGYTKLPVTEISQRQYVEKWFPTSSGTVGKGGKENKTELPLIRLKVRFQTVQILPIDLYKDLSQYVNDNYRSMCDVLEPLVNIKDKEEIATTLIKIMQKLHKAKDFLCEVVMSEVLRVDNNHLTFRGNSIATKAMEAHMKLVGEKYLNDTIGDFVRTIIDSEDDCEVDPTRVALPTTLPRNQSNLRMFCDIAWTKIITSMAFFPRELWEVFGAFRAKCREESREEVSENLISASIFLRFLCPAIMSPSLFHLTQEFPGERAARSLTLIAKTIQTLANFSKFSGKEEYMTFMNDFVEEEWCNMKDFIHKISSTESSENFTEYDGYIDMGKELSVLHTILNDTLEKATEDDIKKLDKLPTVLSQVSTDLKDPTITVRKPHQGNRKSQHYDNLVNIQAHIDQNSSPTELLRDMLRQCSETEDLTVLTNGNKGDDRNSVDGNSSDAETKVEVSNVSVSVKNIKESHVNQTWNQIVSAAELVNGDYIDLISFMDEETHNSSMEMEQTGNGSQMSISQVSTVASSGYQSFGYSQSSSPVDSQDASSQDAPKSPNNNSCSHSTPLSFSNPMYRHTRRGITSHVTTSSPIPQASSSSSLSSDEANTIKNFSPVTADRSEKIKTPTDSLRRITPRLSNSSSADSVTSREKLQHSVSNNNMCYVSHNVDNYRGPRHSQSNNNVYSISVDLSAPKPRQSRSNNNVYSIGADPSSAKPRQSQSSNNVCVSAKETTSSSSSIHSANPRKFPMDLRASSPVLSQSAHVNGSSSSSVHYSTYSNTIGSTPRRNHELSQSVDMSYMSHRYGDQMRRTATDSILSQRSSSPLSDNSSSSSTKGHLSPEDSSLFRRLSATNAVHMGIRSVQRRINEQEKTKQEYESEVNVLKQQLMEAQQRLQLAEDRLQDHAVSGQDEASDWQTRLEESEERMRRQQAEKDDQMKNIIQRLMHVESELRGEQEEIQKVVTHKQAVIEAQEQRIHSLDVANNKLVVALSQLKEHYNATAARNGMIGGVKTTALAADIGPFKTSSC